jgi:hypothetical protein
MTRNKTNSVCKILQQQTKKQRNCLYKFRAGDGSWVYGYDPAAVIPVEESSSCHPEKVRQVKSDFKSMLFVFLDSEGVHQKEFFPSVLACESTFLHRSTKAFCGRCQEKMPDKWCTQDWLCVMTTCHPTLLCLFSA